MKVARVLYSHGDHKWIAFARDPDKADNIIDTIEYMIIKNGKACILDPGGIEVFPALFNGVASQIKAENIEFLFTSHQDPDIISSLPLWLALNPALKCYVSRLWVTFIPHFGCEKETLQGIPDEGSEITLGGSLKLKFVPAHYLHSSGNFHVYDPEAKILFSGDIGAALLPPHMNDLFVTNFDDHTQYMKGFHERWMGSQEAKNNWVDQVSRLKIDMICPQHGSIIKDENVPRFLEWMRDLKVGSAIRANRGA